TFPQVARRAGGHDVLPDRIPAPASRHDVVERQAAGRAAVLAAPAVPREECAAGDPALDRARDTNVGEQPDHVRPRETPARRAQRALDRLDDLGLALEHEHVRAPYGADVQRLEARVQDEDLEHEQNCTVQACGGPPATAVRSDGYCWGRTSWTTPGAASANPCSR